MVRMGPHGPGVLADLAPPVLGLTGAIAAGKSAAGDFLGSLGCVVSRSDEHAHEVLRDSEVVETLVGWWGTEILDAEGAVCRPAVARRVFGDLAERDRFRARGALPHDRSERDLEHPRPQGRPDLR